jgi:hypothetical protein
MKPVTFLNLEVTPSGILERGHRDRRQRLAFIANDGIERLEFGHGFVAERLPLQVVFGLAVLALGVYLVANAWGRLFAAGVFCAPLGGFFVVEAQRVLWTPRDAAGS